MKENKKENTKKKLEDVTLNDIYFGSADANNEAEQINFLELFYIADNDYYQKIVDHNCYIIRGRKGTGKTLLANYSKEKLNKTQGNISNIVNLETFKKQRFLEIRNRNFQQGEEDLFWKWVILIEISRMILSEKSPSCLLFKRKYRKLKKFLMKLNNKDEKTATSGTNFSLSLSNKFPIQLGSTEQVAIKYAETSYVQELTTFEELVQSCLDKNVYLFFDDLDEMGPNIFTDPEYKKIMIGLLNAISPLRKKLKNNNFRTNVIILIREDILSELNVEACNLNKAIEDNSILLSWIPDNLKEDYILLENLIYHKMQKSIENSTGETVPYDSIKEKWFEYRPETSLSNLIKRTMGRPRDIITLLNKAKSRSSNATNITNSSIKKSSKSYSVWLLDEIKNEMNIYRTGEYINEAIHLLKAVGKNIFSYSDIEKVYVENKNSYLHIDDLKGCLVFLARFSVIGNQWDRSDNDEKDEEKNTSKKEKKKKKVRISFAYREISFSLDFNKNFIVHSGLISALHIN